MLKSEYSPIVQDLYLLDKKKVVTADYHCGNIVCFSLDGIFLTNWVQGFFESERIQLIGKIIRPRWDHFEKRWVKTGSQYRWKLKES